ncbi:MAG TPA: GlsB/YeaQ/YmgE family stress response membrane protein [Candidatus Saccharimonadales bacterium]|nr:GlsB/YeaQ/YmgE family stress response membrane protein [Candidatus Saccharimonadales bacterium]
MTLLVAIILGGIIGWIAGALMGRDEGILGSIAIGIVGSIIGSILAQLFNSGNTTYMTLSWAGFVWSLIGAVIFAAILNAFQHRTHHNI